MEICIKMENTDIENTLTIDKDYLRELIDQVSDDYEGFLDVSDFRSEALKTLYYLVRE